MGLVLAVSAYAALFGKGMELIWTRVKLLRALRPVCGVGQAAIRN